MGSCPSSPKNVHDKSVGTQSAHSEHRHTRTPTPSKFPSNHALVENHSESSREMIGARKSHANGVTPEELINKMVSSMQGNVAEMNSKSNNVDLEVLISNTFEKYSQEKIWDDNTEVILRQDISL